jgi:hypothetical protein
MAKTKTKVVEEPQVVVKEPQVVKQPKVEVKKTSTPKWEIKDRVYKLKGKSKPVVYIMRSRGLFHFDEEKGYEREMKYCRNQKTVFIDEMKGPQRLGHIIFRDGFMAVPKNEVTLQKLLSLYHPDRNSLFYEQDHEKEAASELDILNLEIEALQAAASMEVDQMEAILRTEIGSKVTEMKSKELKRDLLIFAKKNPSLFLELTNDENIEVRNMGIRAVEHGIIKLAQDQRTFHWGSNDRKIMTVPFDENPYSALAAFFKTDDGIEIYQTVEKRLK